MVKIVFEQENLRAAARDGENLAGECQMREENGGWIIEHTKVDEAYGGQGIAKKLVMCLVEAARGEKIPLSAECTYAKSVLEKL